MPFEYLKSLVAVDAQRAPLAQSPLFTGRTSTNGFAYLEAIRSRRSAWRRERQFAQRRPMPIKDLFDHIAEIIDDVEAIGNLNCLRGTACCPLGIRGASVTRHDLDAGLCIQPVGEGSRRAIPEQLDGSALVDIDQDRAVRMATPLTPVIHPEHAWGTHRRQRGPRNQPQQCRATRLEAMPFGKSCARLTAQDAGEIEEQRMLGECAPGARRNQLRQSLGEDSARTASVATEEPTDPDVQHDRSAGPRKIIECALITAVDAM